MTLPTAAPDDSAIFQNVQNSNAPPKEFNINPSTLMDVGNPNPQPSNPLPNPKNKNHILPSSSSPSPVIRSSIFSSPSPITPNPNFTHSMAVDKVSAALDCDPMENDSGGDDCFSDGDGSAMLDDDEPDDLMTKDQYQEEVHRETLIRKGTLSRAPSQKKGRLVAGESSS